MPENSKVLQKYVKQQQRVIWIDLVKKGCIKQLPGSGRNTSYEVCITADVI